MSPTEAWAWQVVQSLHRSPAGIDGVLAEFELDSDLHEAGKENDPETDETCFGSEEGSGKELA